MNTITKTARKSTTALLFGLAALTSVNVFAMQGVDEVAAPRTGLGAIVESIFFRNALQGCRAFDPKAVTPGSRYMNIEEPCNKFFKSLTDAASRSDEEIERDTYRAFTAHRLMVHEEFVVNEAKHAELKPTTSNQLSELNARKELRWFEAEVAQQYPDLVKRESTEDRKRVVELEEVEYQNAESTK
jgi:hypothetical protein